MLLNAAHLKLLLQLETWAPSAAQSNITVPHPGTLSDLLDAKLIDRDSEFNLVLTSAGQSALLSAVLGMQEAAARASSTSQTATGSASEFLYVIRYDDGAYNHGPEGSDENGFPVTLAEASRYSSLAVAEEKAVNLRYPDGSGVTILTVQEAGKSHKA